MGELSVFAGQLNRSDEAPIRGNIQIEDGRVRIWTDRRRLVSWDQAQVRCERSSPFRFDLTDGEATYEFHPVDPAAFSEAIGAVVDLRPPKTRFGLADRIRQAQTPK